MTRSVLNYPSLSKDYFVKSKRYYNAVGMRGLIHAIHGKIRQETMLLHINRPDIKFPFYLRVPSSDVPTFTQVFLQQEYDFDVKWAPRTILDARANIGLVSVYFANKFPDAKIVAIEPEQSNLEILRRNISPYNNISLVCGALWDANTRINLVDPKTGKWGFMTQAQKDGCDGYNDIIDEVQGFTVDSIMEAQGIDYIDILKIDIEGSEREVFRDPSRWIGKVGALIIELHEDKKPGCLRSFYCGSNGFDNEWAQHGSLYLARNTSCLTVTRQKLQARRPSFMTMYYRT